MNFWYILMIIFTIMTFFASFIIRRKQNRSALIGYITWILLSLYFIVEYIVIKTTEAPYNFYKQPMSDLGVTTCGKNTYVIANYLICSPNHLLMNWTFTLTGIAIFVGAILIQPSWPNHRRIKLATILLIIFGLSYSVSGIIPADINFKWHTLSALPGMVVHIPALIMIGNSVKTKWPKLSIWTYVCVFISTTSLLLLFFQPFVDLPGGLLQRILYGSVYLWMTVTAIILWKYERITN